MLLAEGKLALKDEVYVPVGDLTSLAVPETLTALIAARLDGLPHKDRALIIDAPVLGQSFAPAALAALAAVTGQDEAAIEPRMQAARQARAARRREVIVATGGHPPAEWSVAAGSVAAASVGAGTTGSAGKA
jgi:hypothetical protein